MKIYMTPQMEIQVIDAQDVVCTSGNQPVNGVSVGDGGNDIQNWYIQF